MCFQRWWHHVLYSEIRDTGSTTGTSLSAVTSTQNAHKRVSRTLERDADLINSTWDNNSSGTAPRLAGEIDGTSAWVSVRFSVRGGVVTVAIKTLWKSPHSSKVCRRSECQQLLASRCLKRKISRIIKGKSLVGTHLKPRGASIETSEYVLYSEMIGRVLLLLQLDLLLGIVVIQWTTPVVNWRLF